MDDPEVVIATMDRADLETPAPGALAPRAPRRDGALPAAEHTWRSPKVITSAVSGTLLLLGWLIHLAGGPSGLSQACAVAAILSGAFYFGRKALSDLVSHHVVGFYFLMSAAAVVSALIGHAQEGGILVFLTSISEAAQDFTEWKTRSAIHALMNLAPKTRSRSARRPHRGDRGRGARRRRRLHRQAGRGDCHRRHGRGRDLGCEPGADHRREPAGDQGARRQRVRRQHQRPGRAQGPGDEDLRRQHSCPDHPDGAGGPGEEGDQPAVHRAVRGQVQPDRGAGGDRHRRASAPAPGTPTG